jgi:GAF domain-containing protein
MVIEDLTQDSRFANNPFVTERGIRFYAGVPLCTKNGHAVGSLCVIDTKPRKISEEQQWLLSTLANNLMQFAEEA